MKALKITAYSVLMTSLAMTVSLAQTENDDLYFSAKDRKPVTLASDYKNTNSSPVYSRNGSSTNQYPRAGAENTGSQRYNNPDYSRYKEAAAAESQSYLGRTSTDLEGNSNPEYYNNDRYTNDVGVGLGSSNQSRFNGTTNNFMFNDPYMYSGFGMAGCWGHRPAWGWGYSPFVRPGISIGLGWSSWGGWNTGIGFGYGWGGGFYDPFWGPGFAYNPWGPRWGWGGGWYDPFWGPGFAYGPGWGWGGGWGSPYWNGYHHGFHNGYYSGLATTTRSVYGPNTGRRGTSYISNSASGRGRSAEGNSVGGSNPQRSSGAGREAYTTRSTGRQSGQVSGDNVRNVNYDRYRSGTTSSTYSTTRGGERQTNMNRDGGVRSGNTGAGNTGGVRGGNQGVQSTTPRSQQPPSYYRGGNNAGYNTAPSGGNRGSNPNYNAPSRQQPSYSNPPSRGGWNTPQPSRQSSPSFSAPSRSSSPSMGGGGSRGSSMGGGGGSRGGGGAPRGR